MSVQHTPTPWLHNVEGYPEADIKGANGRIIAHTWNVGASRPKSADALKKRAEEDRANARRIVACVNACAGIPTEKLEGMLNTFAQYISDIGGIAAGQAEQIECLKDQRAELLKALELATGINPFGSVENAKARDAAIEAIASIKSATKEIQS